MELFSKPRYKPRESVNFETLDIVAVGERLGIEFKPETVYRTEAQARCWACTDRKYHVYFNTAKNVFWCARCGYTGNTYTMLLDFLGEPRRVFEFLRDDFRVDIEVYKSRMEVEKKINTIAPVEIRHAVYTEFLKYFALYKHHRDNLEKRGLSPEDMEKNGYKSIIRNGESKRYICRDLLRKGYSLQNIPGFYVDENGEWTYNSIPGFLVPVRDFYGRIQGLQIRVDEEIIAKKKIGKYIWFSSSNHATGTACNAGVHVSIPAGPVNKDTVYITEGPLKADVASKYMNAIFLAVPGVSLFKRVLGELEKINPRNTIVLFDADKAENQAVKKAEDGLLDLLKQKGYKTMSVSWDIKIGKGIDDIVVNNDIKVNLQRFIQTQLSAIA